MRLRAADQAYELRLHIDWWCLSSLRKRFWMRSLAWSGWVWSRKNWVSWRLLVEKKVAISLYEQAIALYLIRQVVSLKWQDFS